MANARLRLSWLVNAPAGPKFTYLTTLESTNEQCEVSFSYTTAPTHAEMVGDFSANPKARDKCMVFNSIGEVIATGTIL